MDTKYLADNFYIYKINIKGKQYVVMKIYGSTLLISTAGLQLG